MSGGAHGGGSRHGPAGHPGPSLCSRKWRPHLGTGFHRSASNPEEARITSGSKALAGPWGAGDQWLTPPQSRHTSCPSFSERKKASPLITRPAPMASLTSCLTLKSGALARQHRGCHIHNPSSGTLQSFPEDPGGQKSADHRDSPSTVSQEGTALRESRSV